MHNNSHEEKLINISLSVDESHLVRHIQSVVQRSVQFVRQEVIELRNALTKVTEDVEEVRRELHDINASKLKKVATTLLDVRTAVMESRSGCKAYLTAVKERKCEEERNAAEGIFDHSTPIDKLTALETTIDGGDDDVDLDGERIKNLETLLAALNERFRNFAEETVQVRFDDIDRRHVVSCNESAELLQFLGLERSTSHKGILHTLQSIASSRYLSHLFTQVETFSRRVEATDAVVGQKCDKKELQDVHFAIVDIRGCCEGIQRNVDVEHRDSVARVAALSKDLNVQLEGKVGWADLERWKGSVNEALSKTKDTIVKNQRQLSDLQLDGDHVRRNVDDLKEKVVEILSSAPRPRETAVGSSVDESKPCASVDRSATDFSELLEGLSQDSNVKRRLQQATQAAYYAYAEVGASTAGISVKDVNSTASVTNVAPAKKRPTSALLVRR